MSAPPYVITAAMVGAETTREQTPYLPITAEREAGGAMVDLHVRTSDGKPSQDAELFRAAIRAIRARCDVLIQTSTGGAVGMTADERCGPLTLTEEAGGGARRRGPTYERAASIRARARQLQSLGGCHGPSHF